MQHAARSLQSERRLLRWNEEERYSSSFMVSWGCRSKRGIQAGDLALLETPGDSRRLYNLPQSLALALLPDQRGYCLSELVCRKAFLEASRWHASEIGRTAIKSFTCKQIECTSLHPSDVSSSGQD